MFSTKPEAFKSTCFAFWKNDAVFNNAPCFELKCICASWKVGRWLSPPPLLRTLSLQKIKSSEAFWHFRLGWGDIGKAFLSSSWKCTSGWYVPEIVHDARLRRVVLFFPWFQVFFLASWAADGVKTRLRTATSTQDYPYAWNLRWQNSRLFLCDLSHPIHFLFAFILKIWIYLFHQVQPKSPHLSIMCSTVVCSERLPVTLHAFKARGQSFLPGFASPLACVPLRYCSCDVVIAAP